jgi:hypothetical protein
MPSPHSQSGLLYTPVLLRRRYTLKATTTVRAKRLPITRGEYVAMLKDSLGRSGFARFMTQDEIEGEADELLRLAAAFPSDVVIEKRGDHLQQRA